MTVAVAEHRIQTAQGELYACSWTPPQAEGAAIVLVHDSLGCVALWRDFSEQLALRSGRAVIAYDRLGFGQSTAHPGLLSGDFISAEAQGGLARVIEHFALAQFVLFGHSVGGAMAVAGAARYPQACQALITESAQAFVEPLTLAGIRAAQAQFADPEHMQRLAKYHGDKAHWVLHAWTDTWLSEAFANWTLSAQLSQVHCPLLSLHGSEDEYGSVAQAQSLCAGVAGPAQLALIEACGHVPHRQWQALVLQKVQDFLQHHLT